MTLILLCFSNKSPVYRLNKWSLKGSSSSAVFWAAEMTVEKLFTGKTLVCPTHLYAFKMKFYHPTMHRLWRICGKKALNCENDTGRRHKDKFLPKRTICLFLREHVDLSHLMALRHWTFTYSDGQKTYILCTLDKIVDCIYGLSHRVSVW